MPAQCQLTLLNRKHYSPIVNIFLVVIVSGEATKSTTFHAHAKNTHFFRFVSWVCLILVNLLFFSVMNTDKDVTDNENNYFLEL